LIISVSKKSYVVYKAVTCVAIKIAIVKEFR